MDAREDVDGLGAFVLIKLTDEQKRRLREGDDQVLPELDRRAVRSLTRQVRQHRRMARQTRHHPRARSGRRPRGPRRTVTRRAAAVRGSPSSRSSSSDDDPPGVARLDGADRALAAYLARAVRRAGRRRAA